MLVKLPEMVTGWRGAADALSTAYRAKLRSRIYRTAWLNVVSSPEVVPVTTRDGARLRVYAYGPADRNVIVLVHGWSCCLEYWNPQINAFAGEYRVIVYDQRGHGESEVGSRLFGAEQLADDLSEVLDAVLRPGQRAVVAGHSMGGMTIQAWAENHPEQVAQRACAVLLAATAARNIPARSTVVPFLNNRVSASVLAAETLFGTPMPLPGSLGRLFTSRIMSRDSTADQVDFALSMVRSCRPSVRATAARGLARLDLGAAAAKLTVPTSIIAGEFDRLLPLVHSREIADILAAVGSLDRFTVLPTGHLPNIEAPHEFNAELHRMIRVAHHGPGAVAS